MPLSDAFDNTAPVAASFGIGSAFSNTGPTAATLGSAAAFDNGAPATVSQPLAAAFSNTGPTAGTVGNSGAFNNAQASANGLGVLTVIDTSVHAVTTANLDLTALKAGDVIDGVTLSAGNLLLVKNQNYIMQNGIYYIGALAGQTARAYKMDSPFRVIAQAGTVNNLKTFLYEPQRPYEADVTNVVFIDQGATAH